MSELKDANTNPWYVLMTLYGEQEKPHNFSSGFEIKKLAEMNRRSWNSWMCQDLDNSASAEIAKRARIDISEERGWEKVADEVRELHRAEMLKRNGVGFKYHGIPDPKDFVDFWGVNFSNSVSFFKFIFTQIVEFDSSNFMQDADFTFAVFAQDAIFHSATFTQNASFRSAKFDGPAKFEEARFGLREGDKVCIPNFADAEFAKNGNFRKADFAHHYPILEGAALSGKLVLTATDEFWPPMDQVLLAEVAEGAWKIPTKTVAKESCATLRHEIGRQGLPEEEHFFFRREMEFSGQIGSWWRRLPYRLFGWFSNYGESIQRPSLWLLGLWVVPALILLIHFAWVGTFGDTAWSGLDAWGLSFANIFTVFGFHRLYFDVAEIRKLPSLLKFMGALQTVLALPLLFFLGLGLRKRFRVR